ncbi:MAG: hypothetical protein AAGF74_07665 [Pseudomonadota bacterium]
MDYTELSKVKTYLGHLQDIGTYPDLLETDTEALAVIANDASGADWADHYGAELIRSYWVEAETVEEQADLGHVCHMREVAWLEVQCLVGPK